jgi:5-formaminoimidazole-4-carboxamide-1-(beta)-D-ribofuranosyl 5'-monophosphate synthetase
MISQEQVNRVLEGYNKDKLTVGVLGGHSALDVCSGAKKHGFHTVAVCQRGREKTYGKYYKSREGKGVIDDVIIVDKFGDIILPQVQEKLREMNTVFIHNRYFWVYCDYSRVENDFLVPILGTRDMIRLEERDVPQNQYYLLERAGIRIPKIFSRAEDIDRMVLVKAAEAARGYERAFFFANSFEGYKRRSEELLNKGIVTQEALDKAVVEEYILGAHVNLNYFYSPLTGEVELMGTDMRRQTNLDGLLRLPANEQVEVLRHMKPKLIETGHVAVTIKESLLEKVFDLGERFVSTTQREHPPGIKGPFALQGAVAAEEGREEFVIFDVSMRIPGSPGTPFTPYSHYLYGRGISYGERLALEIKKALERSSLEKICT